MLSAEEQQNQIISGQKTELATQGQLKPYITPYTTFSLHKNTYVNFKGCIVMTIAFLSLLYYCFFTNSSVKDKPQYIKQQQNVNNLSDDQKSNNLNAQSQFTAKQTQKQTQQQDQDNFQIEFTQKIYHNPEFVPEKPAQKQNPWVSQQQISPSIDKYFFKYDIDKVLALSRPDLFYGSNFQNSMANMKLNQLQLAIKLMQAVHNVDFKGQLQIQMAPYDKDPQEKQTRIKKLLDLQENYYNDRYQLKKYLQTQLPFCLVTPSYNNVQSRLYLRNLDSIFMQNYQNYHVVYIDDASPDKTGEFVKKYIQQKNIPLQKIQIVINEKNILALNNIYNAIHYHCNAGQIVALIDGDDAFIGRNVLGLYNAIYQKSESGLVYSNYLHVMFNEKAVIGGSSRSIPPVLLQKKGGIRRQRAFYTSHLLTFYVDLFRMIKKQDLTYENGTFFKYAYDVAMCTPMLQMLGQRIFYIIELTYQYRYDTGQNDPMSGQQEVTNMVYDRSSYKMLQQVPFIEDRQNYLRTAQKHTKIPL